MNNKFDELAKGLAKSVTRRAALKKFGVGLTGFTLVSLGLANKSDAANKGGFPSGHKCKFDHQCASGTCYRNSIILDGFCL